MKDLIFKSIFYSLLIVVIFIFFSCNFFPLSEDEYYNVLYSPTPTPIPIPIPSPTLMPTLIPTATPTPNPEKCFQYNFVELGNDSNIYFSDANNNKLIKYEIDTDSMNEIISFSNNITGMIISNDKNLLYIAEGTSIWQYNITSETINQIYTHSVDITVIHNINEAYFIICDRIDSTWRNWRIIRKSDFIETDSTMSFRSQGTVFSILKSKLYTLCDGIMPNDIVYLEINTINGTYISKGDSIYHGDYYVRHPLKLFPNESKISVGTGNIFNTDNDISYSGTLNYYYTDLIFNNNIYVLTYDNLVILSQNSPYTLLKTSLTFSNVNAKKLFKDGEYLIIITQNNSTDELFIYKYHFSEL